MSLEVRKERKSLAAPTKAKPAKNVFLSLIYIMCSYVHRGEAGVDGEGDAVLVRYFRKQHWLSYLTLEELSHS